MCFVWISEQTAIISLYSINWLVFITETECVYCAVRTEYLNVIQVDFSLQRSITVSQHMTAGAPSDLQHTHGAVGTDRMVTSGQYVGKDVVETGHGIIPTCSGRHWVKTRNYKLGQPASRSRVELAPPETKSRRRHLSSRLCEISV
jgi:hypothetical protein